jgi:secondary thiamine-phosphate synthase enzyme
MFAVTQRLTSAHDAHAPQAQAGFAVFHHTMHLQTEAGLQFIDLTEEVRALVVQSRVVCGLVNVQTRHTTTAVIVNEHEPLLLEDMKRLLERLAPYDGAYHHNNFAIRTVNMTPDEVPNGHAHCQGLLLSSAATLNIVDGEVQLGQWQHIFFIELDHARPRTISVLVMGQTKEEGPVWNA